MSEQSRDEAGYFLECSEGRGRYCAGERICGGGVAEGGEGEYDPGAGAAKTVEATRGDVQNAQALLNQAQVQLGYAQVVSPISGKVNVRAARQGEVVRRGTPIVTITDLTQTWIYAPLPETEAESVQMGDSLRVVMPSGATIQGKVIAKSAEADFATQRDVSRRKRDIKTIRLKLLIDNPGMKYVPGMIAEVYIPKDKLVTR